MNALNGFTYAQLQIVPGTNARYAPRPLDWPDCYGFNPDQVLILDKAVADAISAHRAHEEFQRWHAAVGERRARIRRKGRWGGSDLQM
jgi:hypothetical protein